MSTNFIQQTELSAWISQAEAARLRGVSRQAISKLIRKKKLHTLEVGGHILVNRQEVSEYKGESAGRPKTDMSLQEIKRLIDECDEEQCKDVLQYVRKRVDIHPLEKQLNCPAELILESIARAADITIRGIRGIITEVAFKHEVIDKLVVWRDITPTGELPYDFLLTDGSRQVNIQVKMQRKEKQVPLVRNGKWLAETQKTRNGIEGGRQTRPYRFGDFDILAVSLQPSTGKWDKFMYTVGSWLLPRPKDTALIRVMQPVSMTPDDDWTDSLETCIEWHFSGWEKIIAEK